MVKQEQTSNADSASFLASIVLSSDDAIEGLTLDGNIIVWNKGCEELYGYRPKEVLGKSILMVYPDNRVDELQPIITRLKNGEHIEPFITQRKCKNGTLIDVAVSASPIKNKKGAIIGASVISRPFAGQERVAQYTRSLIEASLDPFVTISPDGKITDVNEATVQVTGVSRDKLIGSDFSDYFTEPEEAREGYKQVFKEGFVRDYPLAIHHVSGTVTHVVYNATVYRDVSGRVLGVFAAARDITQRKKAEEQQHASSAYARSLIESSLDPLVTISPEGKITDVNHATELITGVTREWLIGSDFSNYFTEPGKAREGYRLVLKEGSVRDYPLAIRHATGKIVDVLYNATVYRDAQGKVQGVFAAARDVTETKKTSQYARSLIEQKRKLAEEKLKEHDMLFNQFTQNIQEVFWRTTPGFDKVIFVSPAFETIWGKKVEELYKNPYTWFESIAPEDQDKVKEAFLKMSARNQLNIELEYKINRPDGQVRVILDRARLLKDKKDKTIGIVGIALDITLQAEFRDKLLYTLKEKEEMLKEIYHRVKNNLQVVSSLLNLQASSIKDIDSRKIFLESSTRVKSMALVHEMLYQSESLTHIDMQKYLQALTKYLIEIYHVNKNNIKLIIESDTVTLGIEEAIPCGLIINELISNSFKHAFTDDQSGEVRILLERKQDIIYLQVSDNGVGFPQQMDFKNSTSLGMKLLDALAKQLNGKFKLDGTNGTDFNLNFPVPSSVKNKDNKW